MNEKRTENTDEAVDSTSSDSIQTPSDSAPVKSSLEQQIVEAASEALPEGEAKSDILDCMTESGGIARQGQKTDANVILLDNEFGAYSKPFDELSLQTAAIAAEKVEQAHHQSRQSGAGAFASPPESLLDDIGKALTHSTDAPADTRVTEVLHTPVSSSRQSSRQPEKGEGPRRRTDSVDMGTGSPPPKGVPPEQVSRRGSSAFSVTSLGGKTNPGRQSQGRRSGTSFGQAEEDMDSLKLIRDLQLEERGLRRRS